VLIIPSRKTGMERKEREIERKKEEKGLKKHVKDRRESYKSFFLF
jgi:hypothetical protein